MSRNNQMVCASSNSGDTFDDDDQDSSLDVLAQELRKYKGKQQERQDQQHLELLWTVSSSVRMSKNDFTEECSTCQGRGEIECEWCHGTGALTVGDVIFCDTSTGCKPCVVCKGVGQHACSSCKGSGRCASWMT
jgi:DnaJ-class molecular chaperone